MAWWTGMAIAAVSVMFALVLLLMWLAWRALYVNRRRHY